MNDIKFIETLKQKRNRLNDKKYPCYTLLASRYCKHGLVIKEDN